MKTISRILCLMLCACFITGLLGGCDRQEAVQTDTEMNIYATFYPLYAATEWLVEGVPDVQLNCLVQPQDGCLRNYQLSDWDLALLSVSDLILAGGRGLESFESILYALGEDGPAVSAVLYNMDLINQPGVNTQEDAQSHWLDPNPHIYMQTDGMAEITRRVANTLMVLDSENEAVYQSNLEAALSALNALCDELRAELAHLQDEKVIVMNEALVYAADEYGLNADLFYERESGEGLYDADLETCLQALKKSDAHVILIEKQAPQSLCNALEDAGYSLARLDILSTRRATAGSDGYFEAQRANAYAIQEAFADSSNETGER